MPNCGVYIYKRESFHISTRQSPLSKLIPHTFIKVFGDQNVGSCYMVTHVSIFIALFYLGHENFKENLLSKIEENLVYMINDRGNHVVDVKEAYVNVTTYQHYVF